MCWAPDGAQVTSHQTTTTFFEGQVNRLAAGSVSEFQRGWIRADREAHRPPVLAVGLMPRRLALRARLLTQEGVEAV
jgi:hypothetical protein